MLVAAYPEENLTQLAGTYVEASINQPTGAAARDPNVLLSDPPSVLHGQPLAAFIRYRQNTATHCIRLDDVETGLPECQNQIMAVGMEFILAELQSQIDAWKATQ